MVLSNEVGRVQLVSGMPATIVQRAQYMNDALVSVHGRIFQAINHSKNSEYGGGIWDSNSVKETIPMESSCMDTSNDLTPKSYSLEEMLLDDDAEMKDDNLIRNQNKAAEFSANAFGSDVSVDVKSKRWRSEEIDKASLLPCSESETTRKKSKKNVSFSDTVVDLENSSKSAGKFDVEIKEFANEDERTKNSVLLVSENANDVQTKNKITLSQKSPVKASKKVKNGTKLMSQSCESDQQIPVNLELKKGLFQRRLNSVSDVKAEGKAVTKGSADNGEVKDEVLMNRNHLETIIPELFQCSESGTENNTGSRSVKKKVKNKAKCVPDSLTDGQNLAGEMKKASQPSKKNSLSKGSCTELSLKTDVKSKTVKKIDDLESKGDRLKDSLSEMFDPETAESLRILLMELAELREKNVYATKKDKLMIDMQMDYAAIRLEKLPVKKTVKEPTCDASNSFSEDVSQYETKNSPVLKEKKDCCPPICDKPTCKQSFEKNEKMVEDFEKIKADTSGTDYKSGKVSPTSAGEKNSNYPVSRSRSDSCSNWRSQCADVRPENTQGSTIPPSSATANWRDGRSNPTNLSNYPSRHNHKARSDDFKRQQANKMDVSSKVEYEDDDMVVIPLYLKDPPAPLSRFKDTNADPESIWDSCDQSTRPIPQSNRTQEVHAQSVRKSKTTSVPRFFDNPTGKAQTKPQGVHEDMKFPTPRKIADTSSGMLNGNCRSRSQSRQESAIPRRSYGRNRSSSAHWGSSLAATSLEQDIFYIVKIKSLQDGTIAKLKILKDDFLSEVRANTKLMDIIPSPGHSMRQIDYSAGALKMFLMCIFSLSYEIPSWITVLEAFALAKKYGINNLKKVCEDYFENSKIPSEEIQQVAACAQYFQAVDALKSSKCFRKVQNFKSLSAQTMYTPQSCAVSCSVLVDPSEFEIPLTSAVNQGLELCNESDVRNRISLTSLARATVLSGIQLKFLAEDNLTLKIICEVFYTKKGGSTDKVFYRELDTRAKSSVKIAFEDEITVKYLEEIEIVVYIEDVLLKICPQLADEFVSKDKFRAKFESSKTGENHRRLFCIEKIFYTLTS